MMQTRIRTGLRRPGDGRVHAKGHLHHHAMMYAMRAATDGNVGLRFGLRQEWLHRQNAGQQQQERSRNPSHRSSLTGIPEREFVSMRRFAYKVSMPCNTHISERIPEQALFSRLADPTHAPLVITSNSRAARALHSHHSLWQQQNKKTAWRTPRILTWDAWLAEMWDVLCVSGATQQALLTVAQERLLWQNVLRAEDNPEAGPMLHSDSLAALALESYHLLEEYCISTSRLEQAAEGKDALAFLQWLRTFQRQCKRRGILSPAALAHALAASADQIGPLLPRELLLIGFDRVTPQQQMLLQKLQQQGCGHAFLWLTPEQAADAEPVLIAADTMEEELRAAACWIRKRLQNHPRERIGVFAPSIPELRDGIDRIFRRVLAPSTLNVHAPAQRLPYEFTLGVPLDTLPQIRAALLLLRWLTQPIAFDDVSFLLVAAHLGGGSQDARARLDAALRADPQLLGGEPEFSWLLRRLRENSAPAIAPLQQSMYRVAALAKDAAIFSDTASTGKRRAHTEWREIIDHILRAAEWTVFQAQTSAEFQLLERWNRMLDELSTLDAVEDAVSFAAMLNTLENAASGALFALETQDAPVQIMGIAESAGMTFDAVWFLNASASTWPPRGQAQPWIPWILQRQASLPYADAQADADHACHVTRRVLSSCKEAVFSFAMEDQAEDTGAAHAPTMDIRISPVILDLFPESLPVKAQQWLPEIACGAESRATNETLVMDSELSVPLANIKVRRGIRFLKQQAACPFQAFAELRLGAAAIEEPSSGVTPVAQGSVAHEVLRDFWTQVETRSALRALSIEQRRDLLDSRIRQALSKFPAHSPLEKELLATEAERLCERLLAWLQVEEQRPDFSVEACEKNILHAAIGGVQFDCRIDRIDKVGKGLALMDYKTGAIRASACDGERPDEPQLPAYAVLMRDTPAPNASLRGVAFASLQAKQLGFKIIHSLSQTFSTADPKNRKPRAPILETEEELLSRVEQWDHTLTQLADHFRAGDASVDPKIPGVTCTYCAQGIFCRVKETEIAPEDGNDEDTGEDAEEES